MFFLFWTWIILISQMPPGEEWPRAPWTDGGDRLGLPDLVYGTNSPGNWAYWVEHHPPSWSHDRWPSGSHICLCNHWIAACRLPSIANKYNYGNVSDDFISSMLTVLTGTAFLAVPFISNIIYIDVKLFWYEMLNTMSFYIMSIIIVNCIPNLYYILLEMEMNIDWLIDWLMSSWKHAKACKISNGRLKRWEMAIPAS